MSACASRVFVVGKRAYGTGSLYLKGDDWYGRWRTPDGRRRAQKIGPARTNHRRDGLSKKDAEVALRGILLDAVGLERLATRDAITVRELGAVYREHLVGQGRKRSYVLSVGAHFSGQIDPAVGSLQVRDFTARDIDRLADRMRAAGLSPKTVRNVIGSLHGMLALAVDRGLLARNPCDMGRLPRPERPTTIRFLTQPELERVLAASPPPDALQAERDWWPVLRLLILTAAMTGMRLGELRGLRWRDLDMGALKVRVCQSFVRGRMGPPKSAAGVRAIPLASRLLAELDAHFRMTPWNQDSDLVLAHPHTGRPLDEKRLMQRFHAALRRADVRPIRIHDLRHTFATTVAASGTVSIRTLQEWMGHEHLATTQIYAAYMPGHREALLLDGAFDDGAPGGQLVAKTSHIAPHNPTESAGNAP